MKYFKYTLLLFFILSQQPNMFSQPKGKHAVIVALSDYAYPPINQILNSTMTANAMAYNLIAYQDWQSDSVVVLLDQIVNNDISTAKSVIMQAINSMPKNEYNIGFFYYVGHGTNEGLVMLNTAYQDMNTIPKIHPWELQDCFGTFNNYCAFIDACYSGVFADSMTTGFIGTSSTATEATWGGSWFEYTPFGGSLIDGMGPYTNPQPIGTMTAENLFSFAAPRATQISGNHPQYKDNIPGELLLTTPAYDVNPTNHFVGQTNPGSIIVNGSIISSPFNIRQYYGTSLTVTAYNQTIDYIDYTFDHWSDQSTDYQKTIASLTSDTDLDAYYVGKPSIQYRNLQVGGAYGDFITLTWDNVHRNPNVTEYQIWRTAKRDGVVGPEEHLADVSSSVNTYVDYDYIATRGYVDLLRYDVRPYYSVEQTTSDPYYVFGGFGQMLPEPNPGNNGNDGTKIITENSLDNYPNPFNPSTTIRYQIINPGHVSLVVYDYLGREIATLVNKEQGSGQYSVSFNASDLASGIYFYRIQANGFNSVKKMILTK